MKNSIIVPSIALVLAALPSSVSAQQTDPSSETPFVGMYAGPEAGLHEHHFYIRETDVASQSVRGRYYRAWALGGGVFVGIDRPVSSRIRIGAEAGVSVGGGSPDARFADGSFYTAKPRYGFRATGKAGYLLTDKLIAYGTFGYGGHRYRVRASSNFTDTKDWGSSFTIGGGIEYRIGTKTSLRFDFRHLDNQMSHFLIGVPVRF